MVLAIASLLLLIGVLVALIPAAIGRLIAVTLSVIVWVCRLIVGVIRPVALVSALLILCKRVSPRVQGDAATGIAGLRSRGRHRDGGCRRAPRREDKDLHS